MAFTVSSPVYVCLFMVDGLSAMLDGQEGSHADDEISSLLQTDLVGIDERGV